MGHGSQAGWRAHIRAGETPCADCEAGHAYAQREIATRLARMPVNMHGTVSGYGYFGCRCQPCKDVISAYKRAAYASRKASAS